MKKLNVNRFDEIYNILEQSFPPDEIRTYSEQKELFLNPLYNVYTKEEEKLKAVMAVWEFGSFLFVEHFAVDSAFRNQGLGGRMLKELMSLGDKKICLEVEPPEDTLAIRRIEFYKRCGFFLNEYEYIQPAISKGRNPIPLFIMSTKAHLSKEEFENVRNTLYKEVYKIDNIC